MDTASRTLATVRLRLAAIAAAHRLGGHEAPTSRPLVKATMKRLSGEHGKPRKQARGLTKEALAAVKATVRIQRIDKGRRRRKETESQAAMRAAVDLALLEVMRDGPLRGSEASALRWGDLKFHTDGSGRLHVLRSKTDQTAEGTVLYLGPAAVDALLAIRSNEAVIDSGASVFGLSARQISRRIKTATKMAGLGEGYSGHSPRVGMAQDLSAAGVELPESVVFGTKGQLAQLMLGRALESGVPFSWFTGDEVYDSDRKLRLWLERQDVPHVVAIKRNEKLWALTERGPLQVTADRLAAQVDEADWVRCSDGAKGPRVYDWAAVEIRPLGEPGKGYWLLARRSLAKSDELAYYVCFGPAGTALEELVRVAGTRCGIEVCFEEAKGEMGLDKYEERKWDGWYRHITLAMLAHAYLMVINHHALAQGEKGATTAPRKN